MVAAVIPVVARASLAGRVPVVALAVVQVIPGAVEGWMRTVRPVVLIRVIALGHSGGPGATLAHGDADFLRSFQCLQAESEERMVGAAATARRCFYSDFQAPNRNPGVCGIGEWETTPIPLQGTLTMLAILPQVLSVWMAKEDETFSMERPFTITM